MKIFKSIWNFIKSPKLWITLAVLTLLLELFVMIQFMVLNLGLRIMELVLRYPHLNEGLKPFLNPFNQI